MEMHRRPVNRWHTLVDSIVQVRDDDAPGGWDPGVRITVTSSKPRDVPLATLTDDLRDVVRAALEAAGGPPADEPDRVRIRLVVPPPPDGNHPLPGWGFRLEDADTGRGLMTDGPITLVADPERLLMVQAALNIDEVAEDPA